MADLRASALSDYDYYDTHAARLTEALDSVIDAYRKGPVGTPPEEFAALCAAFRGDPGRALTLAAIAVMRLAKIEGVPGDA